jgi:predicted nuclease of predicted toxin-antitoxin system
LGSAQISPFIALWINENFSDIKAVSVRSLGMISASDIEIFKEARNQTTVILTKDSDFAKLIQIMAYLRNSFGLLVEIHRIKKCAKY